MQTHWWWWGLAVVLGVLELTTGTLYLLVVAVGLAAGGLVAWLGAGPASQVLSAAALSVIGWLLLRRWTRRPGAGAAGRGAELQLDVGQRVHVDRWQPDRRARVQYRGATWAAELDQDDAAAPTPGEYVIRRIEGACLIIARSA